MFGRFKREEKRKREINAKITRLKAEQQVLVDEFNSLVGSNPGFFTRMKLKRIREKVILLSGEISAWQAKLGE